MSEENKAIIRRQEEELFTQGNLDAADEIYAPNYVGHDPTNHEDIRGLQRLAMILTHATSLFGLLHPIASIVSQGGPPE
jgi:hypothetical protein